MSSDDIIKFALQIRPGMVNALQAAFDFEKAMREIHTLPSSQESLGKVSNALLALGECEECGGPCRWEYADRYEDEPL